MEKTVLLVDKDEEFLEINRQELVAQGFKVALANSAKEAMEKFNSVKPDLVITEIMLENVDAGFSLAYSMKKEKPEIPIIILSDIVRKTGIVFDLNSKEEKDWIKADEFINKPVNASSLVCRVKRFLHEH
ncbi:MAG: Response regulator SaeR [uncultured bacterium]|nr:MAG: Response regulator SaeR [uncultured bacterium]HBH18183.1 hypothetical protein [Cyanobacteria bacterium UBA9579]